MDVIKPIPNLPDALREAAQRGTLIPFVGAGASRLRDAQTGRNLLTAYSASSSRRGKFSHGQLDQISHLNPRVKLSIALGLETEHKLRIDFRKVLHPTELRENLKGRRKKTDHL